MKFMLGQSKEFGKIKYVYWGKSQWYKFRWNGTHIDLGPFSFYDLPQKGIGAIFWILVALIIKPLRIWYHKKYVYSIKKQIQSMEAGMNLVPDSDGIIRGEI